MQQNFINKDNTTKVDDIGHSDKSGSSSYPNSESEIEVANFLSSLASSGTEQKNTLGSLLTDSTGKLKKPVNQISKRKQIVNGSKSGEQDLKKTKLQDNPPKKSLIVNYSIQQLEQINDQLNNSSGVLIDRNLQEIIFSKICSLKPSEKLKIFNLEEVTIGYIAQNLATKKMQVLFDSTKFTLPINHTMSHKFYLQLGQYYLEFGKYTLGENFIEFQLFNGSIAEAVFPYQPKETSVMKSKVNTSTSLSNNNNAKDDIGVRVEHKEYNYNATQFLKNINTPRSK